SQTGPNGLSITVQDKDPTITQQMAGSLIAQFVAYDADRQLSYDNQAQTFYQGQLNAASSLVDDDNKKIDSYKRAHPDLLSDPIKQQADTELQQLNAQRDQDQMNKTSLQNTLTTILLDKAAAQQGASNNLSIQDEPSSPAPTKIESKQLMFYAVLGLG